MATTKNQRSSAREAEAVKHDLEQTREITRDVVDYLTEYAREKPGVAALVCLGAGFVLGWKLKP